MAAFSSGAMRKRDALGSRTRSVPALQAAFGLREISAGKKLLAMEYVKVPEQWPLETLKDRERRLRLLEQQERFGQREEDERGMVAAEAKRQQKKEEKERLERRELIRQENEKRRKELVAKWKLQQLALKAAEDERAEQDRQEEEHKERSWREFQERARQNRVPVECETCHSSGMCQECGGRGFHDAMFLASKPGSGAKGLEFGSKTRGCESCHGCDQGIRGELFVGNGLCTTCAGASKFCTGWCHKKIPTRAAFRRSSNYGAESPPGSPIGSPKSGGRGRFGSVLKHVEVEDTSPKVCSICKGSERPTLDDARWLWATIEVQQTDEQ